ncbi:uncharacterized protein LOC110227724 [Arabidopsis lyrata subsp. lyrata]|uniref:uncharacterized protein LOC110227724 n=1 Tax=Arabidopsis lyrata subsp. lyrata TaxID=81972 RepID=UPI000A29AF76|nr:uncharacterized protein LOC110227724 [Arabidopsis lyrata subsp. lyrata]|eukprot:XP_020878764.1 uncharacterized protein LOC110227724 [Arabidopsis lyrata subsp. lyrata]
MMIIFGVSFTLLSLFLVSIHRNRSLSQVCLLVATVMVLTHFLILNGSSKSGEFSLVIADGDSVWGLVSGTIIWLFSCSLFQFETFSSAGNGSFSFARDVFGDASLSTDQAMISLNFPKGDLNVLPIDYVWMITIIDGFLPTVSGGYSPFDSFSNGCDLSVQFHDEILTALLWKQPPWKPPWKSMKHVISVKSLSTLHDDRHSQYFIGIDSEGELERCFMHTPVHSNSSRQCLRIWWREIMLSLMLRVYLGKFLPWISLLIKEYERSTIVNFDAGLWGCLHGTRFRRWYSPFQQLWAQAITKKDVISYCWRCFNGKRCNRWIATNDRFKVYWSFVKKTIAKQDDHVGLRKKTNKEDNRFDNLLACKAYERKRRLIHLFDCIFFLNVNHFLIICVCLRNNYVSLFQF